MSILEKAVVISQTLNKEWRGTSYECIKNVG